MIVFESMTIFRLCSGEETKLEHNRSGVLYFRVFRDKAHDRPPVLVEVRKNLAVDLVAGEHTQSPPCQ